MEDDDYQLSVPRAEYFNNVHTMALTIGFPRSGSSLVGYLLTAHPHIVMAHEPKGNIPYDIADIVLLMDCILYTDQMRFRKAKEAQNTKADNSVSLPSGDIKPRTFYAKNRYVFVPNQWQNRYKSLEVIGIKQSLSITVSLLKEGVLIKLKENVNRKNIDLKFIFTIRNPYDMIATAIINWANKRGITKQSDKQKMLGSNIRKYLNQCEKNTKLLSRINPQSVFKNRHEDMVASPVKQLTKLCRFLEVSAPPDYLDDCASTVYNKPRKSRYELDWTEEQKEEVAEMISRYDFLSGYDWSS